MNSISPPSAHPTDIARALEFQHNGDYVQASKLFLNILEDDPNNTVALYSMSAIASSEKRYSDALIYIVKAVNTAKGFALGHLAHSIILFHLNSYAQSRDAVMRAIALDPKLDAAHGHLQTVVSILESSRFDGVNTVDVNGLVNRAIHLQSQGKNSDAEEIFNQLLELDPHNFFALYSLGVLRASTFNYHDALEFLRRSVIVAPQVPIAHYAMAGVLNSLGLVEKSIEEYNQAIALDPHYIDAYCNKAALLQRVNRHNDALLCLTQGAELNPLSAKILEGQGQLLVQYKQYSIASQAFERVLQLDSSYSYAEGHLMWSKLHNCDWSNFEVHKNKIIEGILSDRLMCSPYTLMSICDDASIIRKCTSLYAANKFQSSTISLSDGANYSHHKKRIAFLSGDFRNHPVGYLLISLIESFNRKDFELYAFFTGVSDDSDLWRRYRVAFDNYIECLGKSSLELATLMRSLEIDMVIDLSGYTEGSRLDILAYRPAPIQATYLGYPGTLCLPYIDYLIADPRIIPEELEHHYCEKILKLPHCYLPRDDSVVPSSETPKRSDFGLPEEGVVFCSFNHDYKINPALFKVWMDLLKEVPGSVLWLMKLNEGAHKNLTESARVQGVDPARIIFAERVPRVEDHLARYRLADVFIDTFPYNGHTTAGDALRSGLPVVSLYGSSFASRVAASLLHDVGMPELACDSFQEYHDKALQMATDEAIRAHYKGQLQARMDEKVWPPTPAAQAEAMRQLLINL